MVQPTGLAVTFVVLGVALAAVFCTECSAAAPNDERTGPPRTDYCEMLARDVHGKKPGFMAGNKMLYLGGQANVEWKIVENETLGLTHGFFYDGRCRGVGRYTTKKTGTGHDFWGWEFYRWTAIAYGTVIIDGKRYAHPTPGEMIWRPDRLICRYRVAGVEIEEHKFISLADVICSIITSSKPIEIEFAGHSFISLEAWAGSVKQTSTASFDQDRNAVHIVEGGTAWCAPEWGMKVEGKLMYDGLHTVVSASKDLSRSQKIHRDDQGRQQYVFRVSCDAKGAAVVHAMGEDYAETAARIQKTLADPRAALQAKTEFINGLLNEQIPYFRCSDDEVVGTYYYLWSLYFMYFRDVPEGQTKYPHTVTAVNNFQSPFAFDHWVYVHLGAWVTDKTRWGFGNALIWTAMLPYTSPDSSGVPETFGTTWRSPFNSQTVTLHPEGAWKMYHHSGDLDFLRTVYDFYRSLYRGRGSPGPPGVGANMVDTLIKMATRLGQNEDIPQWQAMKVKLMAELRKAWEYGAPHYWGDPKIKDTWHLASMWADDFPDDWARRLTEHWVMDSKKGFFGEVPLNIRAKGSQQIPPFVVNTINTWINVEGMFRHDLDAEAIAVTRGHIRGMNRDYGFPVTPEAWDPNYKPWGDMYYGWDEAILLPLIERIAGADFSVVDRTFVVSDHLPASWDYVEIALPIVEKGQATWAWAKTSRREANGRVVKTVEVKGNPLARLTVQPWFENRKLLEQRSSVPAEVTVGPRGHGGFSYTGLPGKSGQVTITLGETVSRRSSARSVSEATPPGPAPVTP